MIIQCDKCQSKFKLDDSKLKPEGVKVKCKKCSNVFTVFKEEQPQLDLKADVGMDAGTQQQLAAAKDEAPSSVEEPKVETPSFDLKFDEPKEDIKPPVTEEPKIESAQKAAVPQEGQGFSWDQFGFDFSGKPEDAKAGQAAQPEVKEEKPAVEEKTAVEEKPVVAEEKKPASAGQDSGLPEFEFEFNMDTPAATPKEQPAQQPAQSVSQEPPVQKQEAPVVESSSEFNFDTNFSFDTGQPAEPSSHPQAQSQPQAEQKPEPVLEQGASQEQPAFDFDFSSYNTQPTATPQTTTEMTAAASVTETPQEQTPPVSGQVEQPAAQTFEFSQPEQSATEQQTFQFSMPEQPAKEFAFEQPAEKKFVFEEEKPAVKEEPAAASQPHVATFAADKPRANWMKYVTLIFLLVIIIGGGFGFWWWQNEQALQQEGSIDIAASKPIICENKYLNRIFVVTGKVTNNYKVKKSFLRVRCNIYGKDNQKITFKEVFAGNAFTPAELKELSYQEIQKGLSNKMGKSMVNVDISPGKSLDFMVVFDKVPFNAEKIEVEVF